MDSPYFVNDRNWFYRRFETTDIKNKSNTHRALAPRILAATLTRVNMVASHLSLAYVQILFSDFSSAFNTMQIQVLVQQ